MSQWITIFSSFISAIIGGLFTLAGVRISASNERKRQTKLAYQQQIEEMMYFNDTIESIVESVLTLSFKDEFVDYELKTIDKSYDRIIDYMKITSKIDLELSLMLGRLAQVIFESRTTLKFKIITTFKNEGIPSMEILTKRIIARNNELKRL